MNNELFLSKIKEICPKAKKYEFYKNAVIYKDENDNKHVVKENKDDVQKLQHYFNNAVKIKAQKLGRRWQEYYGSRNIIK